MEETAKEKRRYWLKLDKDFLKSPQMKVIKNLPNGKDYIIFYLSLMLESVETVGHLRFTSLVPYNEEMLSSITDTNIDIVRTAIKIFCDLGIMQIFDDGTIFIPSVPKMTGKECESAERVRKYRLNQQQALLCNNDVTKCNDNKDKQRTENNEEETENKKQTDKFSNDVSEIIDYLNNVCNKNYKKTSQKTRELIKSRLNEKFIVEDFKTVIDKKSRDKYFIDNDYLRPETLFGTKFESYLNQNIKIEDKTEQDDSLKKVSEGGFQM